VLKLEIVATVVVEMLKFVELIAFPMLPVPIGVGYAEDEALEDEVASAAAITLLAGAVGNS
jgi:hypothetical protein